LHPAKLWCDIIEVKPGCQILATYAKDFYSGSRHHDECVRPRQGHLRRHDEHPDLYNDLVAWLRQMCSLHPLLKVPENIESA